MSAAWSWRRPWAGASPSHELETFHAYDRDDHAACDPVYGLGASRDEPNEGSQFCADCMAVVRLEPFGRDVVTGLSCHPNATTT